MVRNMGQYNCKQCDCATLCNSLEFNIQSNIQKIPDKSLHDTVQLPHSSLLPSTTSNLCYFQYDPKSIHSLTRIQATWRAYIVRKQIDFIQKQFKTSFSYFTPEEVKEPLSVNKGKAVRSKNEPYMYKGGGLYVGSWSGGFREGSGIMIFRDSARYDGQWRFSRPFGRGRFTYTDGEVYDGMWKCYYVHPKEKINLIHKLKRREGKIRDGYCKEYLVWLWAKEQEGSQFDSSIEGSIDIVSLEGSSLENTMRNRKESSGLLSGLFLNNVSTPRKITSVDAKQISEMSLSRCGIMKGVSEFSRSESVVSKTMDTYRETDESGYESLDLDIKAMSAMLSSRRR